MIARYADWLTAGGLSPATIRLRKCYVGQFAKAHDIADATPDDVVDFMMRPGWQPKSRAAVRASLKSFYGWAVSEGLRADDPTSNLRKVRVPERARVKSPPDSVVRAVTSHANPKVRLAARLGAFAGLRRAEIAGIHADDIGERMLTVTGKGGKTRRVPIHPELVDDMAAARARGGWLFPRADGKGPTSPDSLGNLLRTSMPGDWSAHSLRHWYATSIYRASHDIRAVQVLLGHSNISTTQVYTQIDDDDLVAAVAAWAS